MANPVEWALTQRRNWYGGAPIGHSVRVRVIARRGKWAWVQGHAGTIHCKARRFIADRREGKQHLMARKPKTPKVALTFELAPSVEAIAKTLIDSYHPHLLARRLVYIFRSRHAKAGRKVVLGRAKIVSGLNAFLAANEYGQAVSENILGETVGEAPESFFIVEIARDLWQGLDHDQRKALVDHELMHCGISGEKICIIPHDCEEFNAIVRRHGLWQPDVAALIKAAAGTTQNALPLGPEDGSPPSTPPSDGPPLRVEVGGSPTAAQGGLLAWCSTIPVDTQTLPLGPDGAPEELFVIEVDAETYVAVRDKLGEDQAGNLFLPGVFSDRSLRCHVQNAPGGLRWPGMDAAPKAEKKGGKKKA